MSVLFDDKEVGQVGWSVRDTALSLKLRAQEHLGFPVLCLDVKDSFKTKKGESKSLKNEVQFEQFIRPNVVHAS